MFFFFKNCIEKNQNKTHFEEGMFGFFSKNSSDLVAGPSPKGLAHNGRHFFTDNEK